MIKRPVIPINPIPTNTEIMELKLCFTISVSFVASNFGYFKLIVIPINEEVIGKMIDDITNNRIISQSNENFINIIISPIKIQGIIIMVAAATLYKIISIGFSGRLFKILKDLFSKEIILLVMDVINEVKQTNPNSISGI